MDLPLITVLVASYNATEYLAELVQALQAQTLSCWCAIIVDDASTSGDPAALVATLHEPRVRVIRHETNRGAGAAFNTAFRASDTPFIFIHGGDDLLAPTYFEKTLPLLLKDADVDAVFTDTQLFGARQVRWSYAMRDMAELTHAQWIPHVMLMRREVWERTEGHYEGPELRHGNVDWDFLLSLAESGPLRLAHVQEPLYLYRQHSDNMSNRRSRREHITRECMYRRHAAWIDAHGDGARFVADGYMESAEASWRIGEYARTGALAARAVELCPPAAPQLPGADLSRAEAVALLARQTVALAQAGPDALHLNQETADARLFMAVCNARLGRMTEAREHLEVLLGMLLGVGAAQSMPDLLVYLALLCPGEDEQGATPDAVDALDLALCLNAGCVDAALQRIRHALKAKQFRLALHIGLRCATAHGGARQGLPPLGLAAAEAKKHLGDDKLGQALEAPLPPPSLPRALDEVVYDFATGRRIYWAHRAKDLYEKYGHTEGGFDALQRVVELTRPRRVLELGCGNGRILTFFSRLGIHCVGQDISATALELARQRELPHVTLTQKPFTDLDYPDGYFDLIVSNRVLQHVGTDEVQRLLRSAARMGNALYLNELRQEDDAKENYYHYKHDYAALLDELGMRHTDEIEGIHVHGHLFRRVKSRNKEACL